MALADFRYTDEGVELVGQLARPAGSGPHPAVLIAHEIDGVGVNVRRRAEMLAALGYVALAGDMYGGGIVYEGDASRVQMMALLEDQATLRRRMRAGLAALRGVEGVDLARVAAIGYCFGGLCVLELARDGADVGRRGELPRPAHHPAPGRARCGPGQGAGLQWRRRPARARAQVAAFQEEMTAAGADWQVINYGGALHAFTNPNVVGSDNPALAYDPAADRQSWAAMRAFLDEAIGPVEERARDDQARLPRCRRHALAQ
jgi:dienelactone hydrolase